MVNTFEPFLDNFFTKILFDKLFKVIFIIPDGSCEPYKGSFYTNSSLYGNYEDYIVADLVEEIENKYNTYNRREKWSMMGHSMGGYGAMKIALKYPEKFIGVSALSGPLNITYIDDLLPEIRAEHGSAAPYDFTYSGNVTKLIYSMAGAFSPNPGADPPILFPLNSEGNTEQSVLDLWEKHNPINLIMNWKGNPEMAIHTYCGDLDEFKLAKPNKMFSDTLSKYNLPHTYRQDPNGDHINSLPMGPIISNSDGVKAPNRTCQDLLKNKTDEDNFETLVTSELYKINLNGEATLFMGKAMYGDESFSPDGNYLLVTTSRKWKNCRS